MKKLGCILLCLCLCIGCMAPAAAAVQTTVPFILVSGMNVLPLYLQDGTPEGEKIWPMPANAYLSLGKQLVKPFAQYALRRDADALQTAVLQAVNQMLEPLKCDADGNSMYEVQTPTFYGSMAMFPDVYAGETKDEQGILNAACRKYGAENVYFFNYDWRLDPLEHARDLQDLITLAKRESGSDTVHLACCSMGGLVVMSFLQQYGCEDLRSVLLLSTAFQGVQAVADMYQGDLYLEKNALMRRVIHLGKGGLRTFLFQALMYALDHKGIAGSITDLANKLLDSMEEDLYDFLLKEVFGTMPAILDLVPAAEYEASKAFMLDPVRNAGLIRRTDTYIYQVQTQAKALLEDCMAHDVHVAIVCQYNMQALPVSHSSDWNNDLLIDVTYASGGAVCADLEQTLPENYVQKANDGHNHVSSDRMIDASACMFPDSTWFIKNQAHVDYNVGPTTDFLFWLADSQQQPTVYDNAGYSQFMAFSYDSNTLTPMDDSYQPPADAFAVCLQIIQSARLLVRQGIRLIFNCILEVL